MRFPRRRSVRNPEPLSVILRNARQEAYDVGLAQGEVLGRKAACDDLLDLLKQAGRSPDDFEVADVEEVRVRQLH